MIGSMLVRLETRGKQIEVDQRSHYFKAGLGSAFMKSIAVCHVEFEHALLNLTLHLVLCGITGLDLRYHEWSVFEQRALEERDLRVGGERSPFLLLLGRRRAYCQVRCHSFAFRLRSVSTLSVCDWALAITTILSEGVDVGHPKPRDLVLGQAEMPQHLLLLLDEVIQQAVSPLLELLCLLGMRRSFVIMPIITTSCCSWPGN